jgi:transposase InsO family protein
LRLSSWSPKGGYSATQVARDMGISTNMLHHSDRGSQYANGDFQNVLEDNKICCSMSRRGNCYDNSQMETTLTCSIRNWYT